MTANQATDWESRLGAIYDRGVAAWKEGRKTAPAMFSSDDVRFLASIGCTAQELFDFVDDFERYGEPDYATAREVAGIRREYFVNVLHGKPSSRRMSMEALPAKTDEVDGIAWLPRLIVKARLKLRGEMPDDLMYCCGGDRAFFKAVKMTAPQFLRLAWEAGDDDRRIIDEVKRCSAARRLR